MVSTILQNKPEILQKTFADGSASDSFVRRFLQDSLRWSRRGPEGNATSQKRSMNWEDLCEKSFEKADVMQRGGHTSITLWDGCKIP